MRVYAKREDTGVDILIAIKCDGCKKEIRPNPQIASSGWTRTGTYFGYRDYRNIELDWCPDCEQDH